jgi:hypothetical protein
MMNLFYGFTPRTIALALAVGLFSFSPALAKGHGGGGHGGGHGGGFHGGGFHGGHGYHGGYHHRGGYYGGGFYGGLGYWPYYGGGYGYGYPYSGYYGASYPSYTYSSGYAYPPTTSSVPVDSQPYLTNQTYEPGDGYRYPLYYNPATGTYFYYPVTR